MRVQFYSRPRETVVEEYERVGRYIINVIRAGDRQLEIMIPALSGCAKHMILRDDIPDWAWQGIYRLPIPASVVVWMNGDGATRVTDWEFTPERTQEVIESLLRARRGEMERKLKAQEMYRDAQRRFVRASGLADSRGRELDKAEETIAQLREKLGRARRLLVRAGMCPDCGYEEHALTGAHGNDVLEWKCRRCGNTWWEDE